MKKKILIAMLVLGLILTFTLPIYAEGIKPPKGDHYTFNTVTEADSFIETFDGDLSQWENISGSGAIVDDSGDNVYQHTGGSYVGAVTGSSSWAGYVLEFDVKKVSGSYFNVVFRYIDQNNYYLLEPSSDQVHIALFKKVGGLFTELASRPLQNTTPGVWYHYKIEVSGSSIKVWTDGVLKFDITDSTFSAGKIGIGAYTASVANFDNISVSGETVKIMQPYEILVPLIGSGQLGFVDGPDFRILDNDMTDDGYAWVQVPAGLYDTYDQVRGEPGGTLWWGDGHERFKGKPVWYQHNDPLNWGTGQSGNWLFTNTGITCYSFRLYPIQ